MKQRFIRPFFFRHSARSSRGSAKTRLPLIAALLLAASPLGSLRAEDGPPQGALPIGTTTLRQSDARVAAVGYKLALSGRALCPRPYPLTGLLLHHLAEYEPADRPLMIQRYGLDRGPGVLTVLGGTPAAAAGLSAGDVLLSVNGASFIPPTRIAAERDRDQRRPMIEATERQLETALAGGPAELRIVRQGEERTVTLTSIPGCPERVRLAYSDQMNAFSNDDYAIMTTAMLRYVRNDDELALVLGHELGHEILGHPSFANSRGILSAIGLKPSTFWRREEAADRLAIRLMAAAGYDLDAVIPFWRRYLGTYDWFPQIFRNHPSLGARERIAREEIAAIRGAAVPSPAP